MKDELRCWNSRGSWAYLIPWSQLGNDQIILNNQEYDLRTKNAIYTVGGREHDRCKIQRHKLRERKVLWTQMGTNPFTLREVRERGGQRERELCVKFAQHTLVYRFKRLHWERMFPFPEYIWKEDILPLQGQKSQWELLTSHSKAGYRGTHKGQMICSLLTAHYCASPLTPDACLTMWLLLWDRIMLSKVLQGSLPPGREADDLR